MKSISRPIALLLAVSRHLCRGTLIERLQTERRRALKNLQRYSQKKKSNRWKRLSGRRSVIEHRFAKDLILRLHTEDHFSELVYCGAFEREELHFVEQYLQPGDIVLDIGANIGLYSLFAAKCIGDRGRVFAFEPCAQTFHRLQENIVLNRLDQILPFNLAVSASDGVDSLKVSLDGYNAWNSLGSPVEGSTFGRESVETVTLDSFVDAYPQARDSSLIKIDVEGWESRVLEGAASFLQGSICVAMLIEFNERAAQNARSSCRELLAKIRDLDFRLYRYSSKGHTLSSHPFDQVPQNTNLIAVKDPSILVDRLRDGLQIEESVDV